MNFYSSWFSLACQSPKFILNCFNSVQRILNLFSTLNCLPCVPDCFMLSLSLFLILSICIYLSLFSSLSLFFSLSFFLSLCLFQYLFVFCYLSTYKSVLFLFFSLSFYIFSFNPVRNFLPDGRVILGCQNLGWYTVTTS